jgi:mono/diheme cytochrome c family protein
MGRRLASPVMMLLLLIDAGALAMGGPAVPATAAFLRPADAQSTIWRGVYSRDQAERGRRVYVDACGYCHRDDLSGGGDAGAPPLKGSWFFASWGGRPLGELFDLVRETMPKDNAASLSATTYVEIVSFLLEQNGAPAGATDLSTDADRLARILVSVPPAK